MNLGSPQGPHSRPWSGIPLPDQGLSFIRKLVMNTNK